MKNNKKIEEIYDVKKQEISWIMTAINKNIDISDDRKRNLLMSLRTIFNELDDKKNLLIHGTTNVK